MNIHILTTCATLALASLALTGHAQTATAPGGVAPPTSAAKTVVTPVQDGAAALRATLNQSRELVAKPLGEIDPFTGQAAEFQNLAHQLKLEKAKTAILNERVLQVRALEDMEKTGFRTAPDRPAQPTGQPGVPVLNAPPVNRVEAPLQAASSPRAVTPVAPAPKAAAGGPLEHGVAPAPGPIEPRLVGITSVAWRNYAMFQQREKSLLVPENGTLGTVHVGDIQGNRVMVNGAPRQVNVGGQEVIVQPTTKQVAATLSASPTATWAASPANPMADMRTLGLPEIPAAPTAVRGPQPLPSSRPAYVPPASQ